MNPRAIRFVAALVGLGTVAATAGACQRRPQLRADGCPVTLPQQGQVCEHDPGHSCSEPGVQTYACQCYTSSDGRRLWTCVSAGGPLPPPELAA